MQELWLYSPVTATPTKSTYCETTGQCFGQSCCLGIKYHNDTCHRFLFDFESIVVITSRFIPQLDSTFFDQIARELLQLKYVSGCSKKSMFACNNIPMEL